MKKLFQQHIEQALTNTYNILEKLKIDSLLIASGSLDYFFLDDQPKSFRPNPHFLYFCPDMNPGHFIHLKNNSEKPNLYFYMPDDFWHEVSSLKGDFWEDSFNINVIRDPKDVWSLIKITGDNNFIISESHSHVIENGFKPATDNLLNFLNWNRCSKSDYEIECMREANKKASYGHIAAKAAFFEGKNELDIYHSYLLSSNQREADLPYGNIIALDKNTAILHYQAPKNGPSGKTFLIDAGARYNGYCSDITRTYCSQDTPQEFKDLLALIDKAQKEQCAALCPGKSYVDIHRMAYESVSEALINIGVIECSKEQSLELDIPFAFFPHGVGHPIGLQVHDVTGKQISGSGQVAEQPKKFPYLRTLRTIQVNDALTIEPGVYFIPLLLQKLKEDHNKSKCLNWDKIEKLIPFGGIRIEDDVIVRANGIENLTRPFLP